MSANKIGIKLADGEFYPILEDGMAARKRLVVTTVQDAQPSVQIDLYRGHGPTVEGADYIGSLVIESIPGMPKGEPDIRMDLGLAADGTLDAFAQEASTGKSQSLKVSLEALSEEEKYEVPDFEFARAESDSDSSFSDADFESTDSLPPEADSAQLLADVRSEAEAEEAKEKPMRRTLTIVLIAAGIVILLGLIGFLVFKFVISPTTAAKTAQPQAVAVQAAPEPAKIEPPAPAAAPAAAPEPAPAPAAAAPAPEPAPAPAPAPAKKTIPFRTPGVNHKIKWGDTLWDLSYSYYRDPWVYMRIARANKVKNPDLIICGRKLWIPPK